jgi:energy-coupling factor transporter ATP-binding protein EcfA2
LGKVIGIEGLSFTYQGSERAILRDITLEVEEGEFIVICGATGCGKSTLLKCMNGLVPHMYPGTYAGRVLVDGHLVSKTPIRELARKVGFVFQNPENQLFMFSVEREVAFALENLGYPREEIIERTRFALEKLSITHLAKMPPYELSDGQKQRVALASALALRPRILILDEPTSLLDPYTASEMVLTVDGLRRDLHMTVVLVEHRLELVAPLASRLVIMGDGRIEAVGPPEEILGRGDLGLRGVGLPPAVQLQRMLQESGVKMERFHLSPRRLAAEINRLLS